MTQPQHPEEQMLLALAGRPGRGTFEAHVTIEDCDPASRERFRAVCNAMGVKAVLIEFAEGTTPSQPMTSSYARGEVADVAAKVAGIARQLRSERFTVSRVKLEAIASNEGVPEDDDQARQLPSGCYFEFHIKLALPDHASLGGLREVCGRFAARLSRNAFKVADDGWSERFVTLRLYRVGRPSALATLDGLLLALSEGGFLVRNTQREYTVFDSHIELDAGWLGPPESEL